MPTKEEILENNIGSDFIHNRPYGTQKILDAMSEYAAPLEKRILELEEENAKLKERYFSADEIRGIQDSAYDAGLLAASGK